jgi:hypothetical protein
MAKKSKKRRAWTATEIRELKSLAKKKTAAAKIAKKLKRTEGATRQKAFSIGLSLDSRSWFFQHRFVGWRRRPARAGRDRYYVRFCSFPRVDPPEDQQRRRSRLGQN